jgi:hypothetical protein
VSKEQIYQDLSSLLDEVDHLPLDDAERRRLHGLISDIERHLDTETEPEHELDIGNAIDELAARLEADHPAFTGVLRRIMNTLSSMGV